MCRVILAACLTTWVSSAGELMAQAYQHAQLSFRVTGEPLPNQWQTTVVRVRDDSVLVSGTELERPGLRLHAWLGANGRQLSVQICGFGRPLEPADEVGPAPDRRSAEQGDGPRAAPAPADSVSPKWRRVGYEFSVAPLRPGDYTLEIAGCANEDGTVVAEEHRITLP